MTAITQEYLLDALDSFIEEIKASPNSFEVKQSIVKELKATHFKAPWYYTWWKEIKKEQIKDLKAGLRQDKGISAARRWARIRRQGHGHGGEHWNGGYYCSTCREHSRLRPVLQHTWHPTPIREQMGDIDITLSEIREYFAENIGSLVAEYKKLDESVEKKPRCEKKDCDGTEFIVKHNEKWEKSRRYCAKCNGRTSNDRIPPLKKQWRHPTSGKVIHHGITAVKKGMAKKWLMEHAPLMIEPYASDDVFIKFLKEKKRYLSLLPEDYKYACKKCASKEDVAFINKTAYISDRSVQENIDAMFTHLQRNNWDVASLDRLRLNWSHSAKESRSFTQKRVILRKRKSVRGS